MGIRTLKNLNRPVPRRKSNSLSHLFLPVLLIVTFILICASGAYWSLLRSRQSGRGKHASSRKGDLRHHTPVSIPPNQLEVMIARNEQVLQNPLFHFIHTSNEDDFGETQIKAIESVFYHHPKAEVKMWVTSSMSQEQHLQPFIEQGYKLKVISVDLEKEIQSLFNFPQINRTVVEEFLGQLEEHTQSRLWTVGKAALLRLIKLYIEGGVYLDSDVIMIKPLGERLRNSLGVEQGEDELNGAVLIFDKMNTFIRDCIEDCLMNFDGTLYGWQGPFLLSRVFSNFDYPTDIVKLQPRMRFYPYLPGDAASCLHSLGFVRDPNQISPPTIEEMVEQTYVVHTSSRLMRIKRPEPGSPCACLRSAFCVVSKDCKPRCTLFDPPELQ